MRQMEIPCNYSDWIKCLHILSCDKVSDEDINILTQGTFPGFASVSTKFCNRMTETVKAIFSQQVKYTTKQINRSLEEGDFSLLEIIVKRSMLEMNKCFFFNELVFLPVEYCYALENEVTREMARYWDEVLDFLQSVVEESHNRELSDEVYYLKRRLKNIRRI